MTNENVSKYDLEYKGVKCTGVEWEDYIFYFEYLGKEYVFEQSMAISSSADTDHIRIVIEEQFLPWVNKELLVEQVRKDTAKDIIEIMKQVQAMFYDKEYKAIQNIIAGRYGIELDGNND